MKNNTTIYLVSTITALLIQGSAVAASVPECGNYSASDTFHTSQPQLTKSALSNYRKVAGFLKSDDDLPFHQLALNPTLLSGFGETPAIILAFEKPTAGLIFRWKKNRARPYCLSETCDVSKQMPILFGKEEGSRLSKLRENFDGDLSLILSHSVLYAPALLPKLAKSCFIFNAYHSEHPCAPTTSADYEKTTQVVEAALASIATTKSALDNLINETRPTHILVLATGWNTEQMESLNNYSLWLNGVSNAARENKAPFRPLIIGITWQSTWDDIPKGDSGSVITKGNDADEIGAGWVHRFIHQAILPSASVKGLSVTLIGHSYGVRVLGHSAFLPTLHGPVGDMPPPLLVGFAPAIPVGRLVREGDEPYWDRPQPGPVIMTTSVHDKANGVAKMIGGAPGMREILSEADMFAKRVQVVPSNDDGTSPTYPAARELVLVDYKESSNCQKPGTRGGAHSDVFDSHAGRLIWGAIHDNDQGSRLKLK